MNIAEAAECVLALSSADRFPWDDARSATWTQAFTLSPDFEHGLAATKSLILGVEPAAWSIARWREFYRAVAGPVHERAIGPGQQQCSLCGGSGWEPGMEGGNSVVSPCRCSRGKDRREVHASILEANGAR